VKVLLVGGYPKGEGLPAFSMVTLSGQRLRAMVKDLGIDTKYMDLWETAAEERRGTVHVEVLTYLKNLAKDEDRVIVALGEKVQRALERAKDTSFWFRADVIPLPHPAARRKGDLQRLREGLQELKENCTFA
jgi:hypothetical protein